MQSRFENPLEISGLLSRAEAAELVVSAERAGFELASPAYPPSYRDNSRLVLDDSRRAAWLFERMAEHLPSTLVDERGEEWELDGLNTRFRLCRYGAGQKFTIHRDGAHHEGPNRRSFLTAMIYLNDACEFVGGATRFYEGREPTSPVTASVRPACGAALVFAHDLWHDGAAVNAGHKYIMRTDVMYRRRRAVAGDGHCGYIWAIAPLSCGGFATAGRDKTVRIWAGQACTAVLRGHSLSVTALGSDGSSQLWGGCRDGAVRVWHGDDGGRWRQVAVMPAHAGAVVSTTGAHARRFATGGADGQVAVWTAGGEALWRAARHESWVWGLDWWPDGSLASASEDGTVVSDERRIDTKVAVRALSCLGDSLATGDAAGRMTLRARDLRPLLSWEAHGASITAIARLGAGLLATAGEDGRVCVWRLETGQLVRAWQLDDFVRCLACVDDHRLLSGGYDGSVHVHRWSDVVSC